MGACKFITRGIMILQNKTNRMRVYTLAHEEACIDGCSCAKQDYAQTVHDPRTGNKGVRIISLSIPVSLSILARSETSELPDSVLSVTAIAKDVKAGYLTVKRSA